MSKSKPELMIASRPDRRIDVHVGETCVSYKLPL